MKTTLLILSIIFSSLYSNAQSFSLELVIDTILVRDVSKLRAAKIFTQVFSGNHIFDPSVEYQQVKTFSIHTKGDLLNIDGENTGHTPINVSVVPNALQIFADL